jgi:hypothetical protein
MLTLLENIFCFNNMPKMKLRVNFAKDNNQKTGVAAGAAQG